MRQKQLISVLIIELSLSLLFFPSEILAKPSPAGEKEQYICPIKVKDKPKIDGRFDEEIWQTEPINKEFVSYNPVFGETLPYKTLVWTFYDDKNLYFAFLCYDTEPQKIKTSLTKRDQMFDDDWVGIFLDTLGNKQSLLSLLINPNGIQADSLFSTLTGEDLSPDFVWESAGKITAEGYQVEISIPLRSIYFKSGKEVEMGIMFRRKISRLGISASWPAINPSEGAFIALKPIIYKDLKPPLKLELLPAVTYSLNQERDNSTQWGGKERLTNLGIGLKYGITSSVTAELTIDPDFSQVESDVFQVEVNQRYPLFYIEKRPFFMEGADSFYFFTLSGGYLPHAVNTRQIVNPDWGAKLTGTLGKASIGLLSALDRTQDKKAFFGIARGKYSLGKDNYLGFLYSSREASREYNRVIGTDLGYRLFTKHRINLSFLYSMSGSTGNSAEKDTTTGGNFNFSYIYDTKALGVETIFEHIGKDFKMDTAYLMRTGISNGWIMARYSYYPDSKKLPWLKLISPEMGLNYLHDLYTRMDDTFFYMGLNFNFSRQGVLAFHYNKAKESWHEESYELDRYEVYGSIQLTKWLSLEGEISRGQGIYYDAVPSFKGEGSETSLSLVIQPNKNINQQVSMFHSDLSRGKEELYDVDIWYSRTTYQFNKYFFLRAVLQYNTYEKRLLTDFLASFTLIPGTVLHLGYGGLYESREWRDNQWWYRQGDLLHIKRSFFLKASYLLRF